MKKGIEKIAVVGRDCVFPGALHIDAFEKNILNKTESVSTVPQERWVLSKKIVIDPIIKPDTSLSDRAGIISGFQFDAHGYMVDKDLLNALDMVHKLVLHTGRNALEGVKTTDDVKKRTGVILAAISLPTEKTSELAHKIMYQNTGMDISPAEAVSAGVVSLPASLLARAFGFEGGSLTLDAACASSLYSVKLACSELAMGRCDMMISGGVSRPDLLYTQIGFSQLQALSPSGKCSPFDCNADGLVVGEGSGIFVLKRLGDAVDAGDKIYGVITGCGVSNDIGGSLVTPASEGQIRAMRQAYRNSGWSPSQIQHVECHGSATPVGDQVELNSMVTVWQELAGSEYRCAIGSVKSMIGHLLTAAGAAGMMKTLVAMNGKFLPPSLNFVSPAAESPIIDSGFTIQTEVAPWETDKSETKRRAAVSGFGFGGINAHLLVEEFRTDVPVFQVQSTLPKKEIRVAVIGMGILTGTAESLTDFFQHVFSGNPPDQCFVDTTTLSFDEFHIPPNQIDKILPNQLTMLKAAKEALTDAGIAHRPGKNDNPRLNFGAAVGIEFDFKATDFYLRWKEWALKQKLTDAVAPPLTADRTLGALGGIVASRIAREFQLGGPCFTVSAGAVTGIKTLRIGMDAITSGEAELFLCGCVDMAGDPRQSAVNNTLSPFARGTVSPPFDRQSTGAFSSEGSAAVVLKSFDQAVADGDRIYCVIKGTGSGSAGNAAFENIAAFSDLRRIYLNSLEQSLEEASVDFKDIDLYEAHGSGVLTEDCVEAFCLNKAAEKESKAHVTLADLPRNPERRSLTAVGSAAGSIGDTKGVSALVTFIKTALSCYVKLIAPIPGYRSPGFEKWNEKRFYIPKFSNFWIKEDVKKKRKAAAAAVSLDGCCGHVVVEGYEGNRFTEKNRFSTPLSKWGIFILQAQSETGLLKEIKRLKEAVGTPADTTAPPYSLQNSYNAAREWYLYTRKNKTISRKGISLAVVARSLKELHTLLNNASEKVIKKKKSEITGDHGVAYTPAPMADKGKIAFLYPGSGNHYLQMGRALGVIFPEVLKDMEHRGFSLAKRVLPKIYYPQRISWDKGWEAQANKNIEQHSHNMIFGQISFSIFMTSVASLFNIRPDAALGHSLGESAMLFSLGVWQDSQEMLRRMENSDLFTEKLSGRLTCARRAWGIKKDAPVAWTAAAVNRPVSQIKRRLGSYEKVYILIVNSPQETVIGGEKNQVEGFIRDIGCGAMFLKGIVSVHCPVADAVSQQYLDLHRFECFPDENIDFYSCYLGDKYIPEKEKTAHLILEQALNGFDYTIPIHNAWRNNVRIFLEIGPGSSCTRLVKQILGPREHLSLSLSSKDEPEELALLKAMATLAANGVDIDLAPLFKQEGLPEESVALEQIASGPIINRNTPDTYAEEKTRQPFWPDTPLKPPPLHNTSSAVSTARIHEKFLTFSRENMTAYEKGFHSLTRIASSMFTSPSCNTVFSDSQRKKPAPSSGIHEKTPLFDREMCLEFAAGKASKVLGDEFRIVDTFAVRVRLPDEPLMLVDRILSIKGKKLSLSRGEIVTQHDINQNAWYLDGGRAPVSITIEAGQADLFLCSYLGIDHMVRGERRYRLLDAKVTFHRPLPVPGETIEFHIEIERFLKQGEVYLFFFHYSGYIRNQLLISMRDGCAGFFTQKEIKESHGIVLTEKEKTAVPRAKPWLPSVDSRNTSFDDEQIESLRVGDLYRAFGGRFKGKILGKSLRLPGGRMHLIDRVTQFDPDGGRFKLGSISAQADIKPDHWFLTCHFTDDMVMPGTLMYECCAHALRIFTLRSGWISRRNDVYYDIIQGVESDLKCRGPVTCQTQKAGYYVEIKEMGYSPEPYVKADAHMFADDLQIVFYKNMGMKIAGLLKRDIEKEWRRTDEV